MTTFAQRRLCKSRTDRMIDGVCGGIAGYFGLDPTLVRIAWVLLTLFGGSGVVLYIAAMIIMPKEELHPAAAAGGAPSAAPPAPANGMNNSRFWGILLLVLGVAWLASNFGFSIWHHWWGFSWDVAIPLMLILAGVAFLFGGRAYLTSPSTPADPAGCRRDRIPRCRIKRVEVRLPRHRRNRQSCTGRERRKSCWASAEGSGTTCRWIRSSCAWSSSWPRSRRSDIVAIAYIVLGIVVPQKPAAVPAGPAAAAAV